MKIKLLFAFALGALACAAYFAFLGEADAEPLHYEVQVVTGGRVVAQTYAMRVRDDLARILPHFELFVDVVPHSGVTTVKVTVVSRQIRSRNQARIREILEAAVRRPFVIVDGYGNQRQAPTSAHVSYK